MLQLVLTGVLYLILVIPVGRYLYHIAAGKHTFADPVLDRIDGVIYKIVGVEPHRGMNWRQYALALIGTNAVMIAIGYLILRIQSIGIFNPNHIGSMEPSLAFNTIISFMTNTNLQHYSGESGLSYLSQMLVITFMMFVSAASGYAACVAFIRGVAGKTKDNVCNFFSDLVRITTRVLLPFSLVGGLLLVWQGVPQTFSENIVVETLEGTFQVLATGPVAALEIIKHLGTNGGGFFNANSSHPYENPNMWTNLIEILLMLAIPVALTRTFGRMIGNIRQGYALLGAMVVLFGISFFAVVSFESFVDDPLTSLTGGSMEGKEDRFGIVWSALFGTTSTSTSTGAVNSMHDSYTALGGMMYMFNMMLGEVSPGGVGAGLYGILVMAVVAVFIAGLMVGRTPEYLGKKIGPREMKMASLYFLVMPVTVVLFVALSFAIPGIREDTFAALNNSGNHGLSEVVYAFVSGANNNGSAFAGLSADTPWLDTMIGLAMLIGRFLPIMLVLSLAGSLAKQDVVPETAGTMKTDNKLFVGLLVFVIFIISALTFFPTLALGPLAEGLVA